MIQFKNINKSYDDKVVLENINWNLTKGHVYGLVGPNGSGKSTLLRLLSGVLKPTEGTVLIEDTDVFDNPEAKKKVFFLGDDPYFFNQSTIKDMKAFYKMFYKNFDENVYQELLKEFKLNEDVKINSFSKGMKRQVVVILALASKPDVLLLDEAFDGLDPIMRFKLRQYISQEISSREVIVVISSHNLRELEDICDTIVMINKKQLKLNHETSTSNEIYHKYQIVFEEAFDQALFDALTPLSVEGKDRIFTIVLKGNRQEIEKKLNNLNPMLIEHNPVSLEEIFIYEMRDQDEK
ncbi:MAG TPA: ABC transporter ATP-binding protein [Erysipelothrix sp.]|nr:ABC transporter ATP-binding protein [Erysipelothrix sp.]